MRTEMTFLMQELYHLRQQVKMLDIEEVNFVKERYNNFLRNYLQLEINYLREENENKNSIIKYLLKKEKIIYGSSTNPEKKLKYLLNLNLSLLRSI